MHFVYILLSLKTNKFYVGSTSNIDDRLNRHQSGYSKATKAGVPWKMVYTEQFHLKSDALKRELEIKSWKSHAKIEKLISDNIK
jgi:putative endonuclease